MKNFLRPVAVAIVLISAPVGTAMAEIDLNDLRFEVNSSLGSGSRVDVQQCDGVVTLSGQYGDGLDRQKARRVAEKFPGVTKVINLGTQRN